MFTWMKKKRYSNSRLETIINPRSGIRDPWRIGLMGVGTSEVILPASGKLAFSKDSAEPVSWQASFLKNEQGAGLLFLKNGRSLTRLLQHTNWFQAAVAPWAVAVILPSCNSPILSLCKGTWKYLGTKNEPHDILYYPSGLIHSTLCLYLEWRKSTAGAKNNTPPFRNSYDPNAHTPTPLLACNLWTALILSPPSLEHTAILTLKKLKKCPERAHLSMFQKWLISSSLLPYLRTETLAQANGAFQQMVKMHSK